MPEASVIVPTHSHAATLPHAVASALRQTVADLEVLVVGDGATPDTAAAGRRLAAADPRVTWLERPKGEGHGFAHRHEAVGLSSSEVILYLADDDLWFPEHAETLSAVLAGAGFVAATSVRVGLEDVRIRRPVDLGSKEGRAVLRDGSMVVELSSAGHTASAYRRAGPAWTAAAESNDYKRVWRELALTEGVEPATSMRPTAIRFPSTERGEQSPEQRAAELEEWTHLFESPEQRLALAERLLEAELRRSARLNARIRGQREARRADKREKRARKSQSPRQGGKGPASAS